VRWNKELNMRLITATMLFLSFAIQASCQTDIQPGADKPNASGKQVCEAKGGTYEVAGRARSHVCILPLPDAGKTCETASECVGFCLSDTKQCSAVTPQFGCISHLDRVGRLQTICID
jgi:hypothetical protein